MDDVEKETLKYETFRYFLGILRNTNRYYTRCKMFYDRLGYDRLSYERLD